MKILLIIPVFHQHHVPPTGAFVTSREVARGLVAAGHTVGVITTIRGPGGVRTDAAGVQVWPVEQWRQAYRALRPDLLISHHGDRRAAQITALASAAPHLIMVHGMSENRDLGRTTAAWFPSEACRAHYPDYIGQFVVLPPPIDPDHYRTQPGECITLNGSTPAKGGPIAAALAARLPHEQFLVVRASGHQVGPLPANVEVVDRTDPRQIYTRTRLLLMPSTVESYGRVGVEAMISGIPVIASELPGIREALGTAALYVAPDDVDGWEQAVRALAVPEAYRAASGRALEHARGVDLAGTLAAFEEMCCRTAASPRTRAGDR
ncbi:glycosyltransferase family 4 protein [Streptomyces sp. NPDC002514]|uniref:glycosyltransferase family 4 protein n=1 Tax=Streptomyces sp. NPDC001270 TaxID=3364554 RepID=UPI0036783CA8